MISRHYKRIAMMPGRTIANSAASAVTNGSACTFAGIVDLQGADQLCITIARDVSAGTVKNIWRFGTMSAKATLYASATAISSLTGSTTVNPLSGGGVQYWVDMRNSTLKRYLTCKLSAVTGSTHTQVLCDLYKLETYPPSTAALAGFTTVTEVSP